VGEVRGDLTADTDRSNVIRSQGDSIQGHTHAYNDKHKTQAKQNMNNVN
jgi:hypothetical protein